MQKLKNDLQNEREARKSEIMNLTSRIVHDQARIRELEDNLKLSQHEHGLRGNELYQATQERDALLRNLQQAEQETEAIRQSFAEVSQERERYRVNLEKSLQERQALKAEINQLEAYNTLLQQQINFLRGKTQA